jgi:uncharacterized protein (DUF1778 family)
MAPVKRPRNERLNLRATTKQANLIRRAAREMRSNLSNFVLESACLRAEQALSEKQVFELKPAEWTQFLRLLDRAPQEKPRLRKLLTSKGLLDPK